MGDISDLLNRDGILKNLDELVTLVGERFASLSTLLIIWESEDEVVHHRYYRTVLEVLGLLARANT